MSIQPITKSRIHELEAKFFEFSFEDEEPDREFFDGITNPVDFHVIAYFYNWDDGASVLKWIADSPLCDEGTAKMIFWRSQPDFYTQYSSSEEADYESDVFELVMTIVNNLKHGFYKNAQIAYDPSLDEGAPNDLDEVDPNAKWNFPEHFKEPTFGAEISVIDK